MSVAEVVLFSTTAGLLSDGPRWHEEAGELLWVDILGTTFHRGDPDGLTVDEDGGIWVALRGGPEVRSRRIAGRIDAPAPHD
jgi:sugar lactone lactonase YvrE